MHPIHLNLGFTVIPFYEGFYFLVSILVASWLAARQLRKAGLDTGPFLNNLSWILVGAILGARISHYLFWELDSILKAPLGFLRFWEGGLSITGGLAGGFLVAFVCFRHANVDFWHYFAITSPSVLLGQAIGRVGCFLNGDAWGTPTGLPWGIPLPKFGNLVPNWVADYRETSEAWKWCVEKGYTSPESIQTIPLHPTQLYESLGDLILASLIILHLRPMNKRRLQGSWPTVFWLYLGGYSWLRFGLEFLHGDRNVAVLAGMTALQIALLITGSISVVRYSKVMLGKTTIHPNSALS